MARAHTSSGSDINSLVLRDLLNLLLHIRAKIIVDKIAGIRRGLRKICN